MLRLVLTLVMMGWSGRAAAQCAESVDAGRIATLAASAEEALAQADSDAYRSVHDEMVAAVPCLSELLPSHVAAALHRTGGVRAFLDRDIERATVRFATARVLDPSYQFPDALLPPTHPLRAAYMEYPVRGLNFEVPPRPKRGVAAVDGRIGQGRLEGLPATFQLIDNDGQARQSMLLEPFDAFPDYSSHKKRGVRVESLVAIAAVVGAGALYGAAWNARSQYDDLDTPYSELDGYRTQALVFGISSGVLLGVGVGSGVAAVVPRAGR